MGSADKMASGENRREGALGDNAISALRADFETLRDDIEMLKTDLVRTSRAASSAAADGIDRGADAVSDRAREAFGVARRAGAETTDDVRSRVQDNPLYSVGAALIAGLVVGQLFGRR
ncbi:MAG: DUF883 family protein [Alphaproteobacteria bacterium]|nr:DUF883 family protein [Alphaproteobacteria bacterium]